MRRKVEVAERDIKEERRKEEDTSLCGSAMGHNGRSTGLHSTALCLLVTLCLLQCVCVCVCARATAACEQQLLRKGGYIWSWPLCECVCVDGSEKKKEQQKDSK